MCEVKPVASRRMTVCRLLPIWSVPNPSGAELSA